MGATRLANGLNAGLTMLVLVLFAAGIAMGEDKVLHSFGDGTDGAFPYSGLVTDAAGNFFGVTGEGGIHGEGTVFELSPNQSGGWTERVLHSFGLGTDGSYPYGGLVIDGAGNLYGTTQNGGIHNNCSSGSGCGTVFELSPDGSGGWTEQVLHSFNENGSDGTGPSALIMDAAGDLYGTTYEGGIHTCDCGTVFELMPKQGGGWTERVLHSFGLGTDGAYPYDRLAMDAAGNLYGTTSHGGIHSDGTVFELSLEQGGGGTEHVLHSFNDNGEDGAYPRAGLILDAAGNLYGTTPLGGIHSCGGLGCGTAFELMPREGGGWTEQVLHSFNDNGIDGANPNGELLFDGSGNLYGTASNGGVYSCPAGDYCGAIFELSPRQGGGWTERVLHNFDGPDGAEPLGALIFDAAGNLYGTTLFGGIHTCQGGGCGTVFEITP
jgi:uncharacterized repeat protein (TIGR03803 family)